MPRPIKAKKKTSGSITFAIEKEQKEELQAFADSDSIDLSELMRRLCGREIYNRKRIDNANNQ